MRVAEHLLVVVLIVGNGDVGWVALCVGFELKTRVYEAAEWCDAEGCIATTDLGMKLGVDADAIVLDKVACGLIVALALDTLNLAKEQTEELA